MLQALLRTSTGIFADYEIISEPLLARHLAISEQTVYENMLLLTRMHVLHYIPRQTSPYILFTTSREEPRHLLFPRAVYEDQRRRMQLRIDAVRRFAFGHDGCRVNAMLRYFGENPASPCGKCDICRADRKNTSHNGDATLRQRAIALASQPGGITVDSLAAALRLPAATAVATIRQLVDEGLLTPRDTAFHADFNTKTPH